MNVGVSETGCCQATNELVTRVPKSTSAEMEAAVASCKEAFETWSKTTVLTRQQAMFKLQHLIRANMVSVIMMMLMMMIMMVNE